RQHDPAQCDHVQFADSVADHRKGILPDLAIRGDVVRRINIALVDFAFRHELIDVDGVRAFDLNGVELVVLNDEILTFGDLIPPRNVLPGHYLACFEIHVLLFQSVASLPIEAIETDFFAEGRGRIKGNRTRNEGQPEVALPIGARGHFDTPTEIGEQT